jgi:DnaJ-class molecular chaperone
MNEERLKIRIPPGVEQGQTIRLRGKGGDGLDGARPGDLLLAIQIEKHTLYEREGTHLLLNVPLTVREAMAGAKVRVPTPNGAIRVNIPAGTVAGTTMRIKGRGLPRSGDKRGDLRLVLQPSPPITDDAAALSHAEALDAFYEITPRSDWED